MGDRLRPQDGRLCLYAALRDPARPGLFVPLFGKATRFIRLQIGRSQPEYPWAVADIVVDGQP